MSSPIGLHQKRFAVTLTALVCVLCLWAAYAPAQARSEHKDEIFGGYSWLHSNGYGDLNYKVNDIVDGFDFSNTYYLPTAHNLGILIDGSGHFNGGTTPRNYVNNGNSGSSVGYALGGLQYKYHTDGLSPFVRAFAGGANISPDCCGGTRWNGAIGGGGGLDLSLTSRFSLRLVQVDYIYSNYKQVLSAGHSTEWNSVRLAAGIVV